MDFFGLRKEMEPATDSASATAASPEGAPPPAGPKRFWAVMLVADVLLLFVFGGTLGGLYVLRRASSDLAVVQDRPGKGRKEPRRIETPPPAPDPGKAELPPAAEPKAEAKPEAKAAAVAEKPTAKPAGSPGLAAPALPRRSAEPIASKAKSAEAAPSADPGAKPRAKPVEFTHRAPDAREVFLRGPFLVRTGGRKAMIKDSDGVWHLSVSLLPGDYRYSLIVDGKRSDSKVLTVVP